MLNNRTMFEYAPSITVSRRPFLSKANWWLRFRSILNYYSFTLYVLYTAIFKIMIWLKSHACKIENGETKCPEPKAPSSKELLKYQVVVPAFLLGLIALLIHVWVVSANTYRRVRWLQTFEEDWRYFPSFLESWGILWNILGLLALAIVVAVLFVVQQNI